MIRVSGIAVLVALMIVGVAAASHPVTRAEMYWMSPAVNTGPSTYLDWARVSTRDPHYAAYFAKRCPNGTAVCGGETNPSDVFLLRRAKLTRGAGPPASSPRLSYVLPFDETSPDSAASSLSRYGKTCSRVSTRPSKRVRDGRDILLKNVVDASIVAFWRKGDKSHPVVVESGEHRTAGSVVAVCGARGR